ncbi:MAG: PucR family transcriptional regulator, partial [Conexibacter sp.]|nr:PucR family transcriptional regulator [Conexibacter sp.]
MARASSEPGEPLRVGAVDLRDLLAAHVDELADAAIARFAAGAGPDGAPDAATLRNLRVGA